ncbi:hypothetical protein MmTuc01_2574 [Methanosarcina mazei Tuc01]|uniref:Uncharacterized protein n=1 Tax=Methanosarcina mazei Tuc01 TaxID=1236903 RepID=M1PZW1_METMZ|nr:hypothetical protein MmTuc01_2574 [Methanosarcina mazei Tuc01]
MQTTTGRIYGFSVLEGNSVTRAKSSDFFMLIFDFIPVGCISEFNDKFRAPSLSK